MCAVDALAKTGAGSAVVVDGRVYMQRASGVFFSGSRQYPRSHCVPTDMLVVVCDRVSTLCSIVDASRKEVCARVMHGCRRSRQGEGVGAEVEVSFFSWLLCCGGFVFSCSRFGRSPFSGLDTESLYPLLEESSNEY